MLREMLISPVKLRDNVQFLCANYKMLEFFLHISRKCLQHKLIRTCSFPFSPIRTPCMSLFTIVSSRFSVFLSPFISLYILFVLSPFLSLTHSVFHWVFFFYYFLPLPNSYQTVNVYTFFLTGSFIVLFKLQYF